MTKKFIIGNWKMHLGDEKSISFIQKLLAALKTSQTVVLCPPVVMLRTLSALAPSVGWGAQDCAPFDEGPYTGEISASMLKSAGADWVIVGHSERRHYFHEDNDLIRRKAFQAQAAGLIPIICVGESEGERADAQEILSIQIQKSTEGLHNFIVAYEPLWAIGTGVTPSHADIKKIHAFLKTQVNSKIPLLYGGSVNAENASDILNITDGVLVGGASLKVDEFIAISHA